MEYYSLNNYLRDIYGQKVYKIAVDAGFTCPNRDGTLGTGGCIFCSGSGSGDFAGDRADSITDQIERGKKLIENKINEADPRYIAYFQAFTNTYAPVDILKKKYLEAINNHSIVGISIATRPDCLGDDVVSLISELNQIKPVWVELGLQTIHPETARLINRGYDLETYEEAVKKLAGTGVHIVTHVILGLPYETREQMLETVDYVGNITRLTKAVNHHQFGIKLQLLHIIRGTRLEDMYNKGEVRVLSLEEYVTLVADCLELLPEDMVIHRITGDGAKKTLVAPLWSGDKKRVLNALNKEIRAK